MGSLAAFAAHARPAGLGAVIVVACLLATTADAGVRSTLVKRDYYVSGTTARALVAYMKRVPLRGHRGAALASIIPSYRLDLKTRQRGGTCRVAKVDLHVSFVLTLPRSRHEPQMSRSTRSAWRSFVAFARRHEESHRQIYLSCARNFVSKARRMTAGNCFTLQRDVRALQRKERLACDRRNAVFDRREYKRLPRLRLFRMAQR